MAQTTKILLLGDELAKNRVLVSNLAAKHSFRVSAYSNYLNQIQAVEFMHVDLIVLEIGDSSGDELDWLRKVKRQAPSIKVIVVNSGRSIETVAKAFSYGAADFFRKPLDVNLLSERISSLLSVY